MLTNQLAHLKQSEDKDEDIANESEYKLEDSEPSTPQPRYSQFIRGGERATKKTRKTVREKE